MRLIDADALIKTLETYKFGAIQNEVERAYIKETVINFVKDAPTAYDPEKVKKEIDRVGKSFCDYVACNEECTSCEHHSIMNAVTCVVRKGGV